MLIDYFFSLRSPYAYLAGTRLEALADRRGVAVVYRPMDVAALFAATGGLPVGERHPSRQAYRLQDLKRRATRAGLPINLEPAHLPADARAASVAVIAAQSAGFGVGLVAHALLRAVWAEEKNIAELTVIEGVLRANGVDPDAVAPHREAAESEYARSAEAAASAGVFGSPSYVVGPELFWGADRLDDLDDFLAERQSEDR